MKEIKILVCQHKETKLFHDDVYTPIQVGKAKSKVDLGILGDDEGDNISAKNDSYCELTALYWAWKNMKDVDIIGLCHYRRYFDFHEQCGWPYAIKIYDTNKLEKLDFSVPSDVLERVKSGNVVVAKKVTFAVPNILNYGYWHICDDMKTVGRIISETKEQKYSEAFKHVLYKSGSLCPFNMFLMRKEGFDAYCSWLFPILEEGERQVNTGNYNPMQKRIWGYVAERLFNVWLYANKKDLIQKPVIWINDGVKNKPRVKAFAWDVIHKVSSRIISWQSPE